MREPETERPRVIVAMPAYNAARTVGATRGEVDIVLGSRMLIPGGALAVGMPM
jgi:hypothetical protein